MNTSVRMDLGRETGVENQGYIQQCIICAQEGTVYDADIHKLHLRVHSSC